MRRVDLRIQLQIVIAVPAIQKSIGVLDDDFKGNVCGRIPVLRFESFVILPAPVIFYAPIIYSGVVRVICALCLRVLL